MLLSFKVLVETAVNLVKIITTDIVLPLHVLALRILYELLFHLATLMSYGMVAIIAAEVVFVAAVHIYLVLALCYCCYQYFRVYVHLCVCST